MEQRLHNDFINEDQTRGVYMLNDNIVGGKWKQLKGEIRKAWGQLTDDELEHTRGDLNSIAGIVQQRYGETQEDVRTKLNDFVRGLGPDDSTDTKH
jgi:uncharacterized protein YjbJ (UPF0337 family)